MHKIRIWTWAWSSLMGEKNNRIGPTVKQVLNVAKNVLHNFVGVISNTTAYSLPLGPKQPSSPSTEELLDLWSKEGRRRRIHWPMAAPTYYKLIHIYLSYLVCPLRMNDWNADVVDASSKLDVIHAICGIGVGTRALLVQPQCNLSVQDDSATSGNEVVSLSIWACDLGPKTYHVFVIPDQCDQMTNLYF